MSVTTSRFPYDMTYPVKMERMRPTNYIACWDRHLDGRIWGKTIDAALRQERLGCDVTAQDLEQNGNIGRNEGNAIHGKQTIRLVLQKDTSTRSGVIAMKEETYEAQVEVQRQIYSSWVWQPGLQ